jgi:hypothetical protein
MLQIQLSIAETPVRGSITADNARDIGMNFVRDVYGAPDAPTELMLAHELACRAEIIKRILMGALARLPDGQRNAVHLIDEISPNEVEVCWLVARGDIEIRASEAQ